VAGILTNPELAFVLHVLEQKGHADLLSAPKVTTQAGQDATIKVVTEYIYPTDFAVTPITGTDANGNSTVVGGVVEPSGFETREVGVILEVVPDVSPETQMITLNMTPRVVSEPEWHDYGSEYQSPGGDVQRLNMQQPFFHTREVSTSISIYNGATVVMGGMITERRTDVDDRIPLLGDVPIVGRLFRSRYEQSDKRNLMIFVTARLVDPAGRPIQESGQALPTRLAGAAAAAPAAAGGAAVVAPANP
jgi:general secretion pathway protein D